MLKLQYLKTLRSWWTLIYLLQRTCPPLDSLRLFDVTILLNFVCNFLLHAYRLHVHCVRSGSTADQITMACYCLPLNNFGNVLKFFFVDMNHPV